MTEKLYIDNAYGKAFSAKVLRIDSLEDHDAIILDQTYFYPEGGGQPSDLGILSGYDVEMVTSDGDEISHHIIGRAHGLKPGDTVECELDWDRRFTLMQQHTGQHILSSCAEKLFDANTVGFHIGDDYVTVDLDVKLDSDQLDALERMANQVVYANMPVHAHYPSAEELAQMPLRKQPKVAENIRVIEVDQTDFSPCGGTHVARTGEIGIIKVKRMETYKSGVRLEFGCGYFALESLSKRNQVINDLMRLFSVKDNEILPFCEQLLENQKRDRYEIEQLKEQSMRLQVEKLLSDGDDDTLEEIKVITLRELGLPMTDLRLKVSLICERENFIVFGCSHEAEKTHVVLAKSKNLTSDFDMGVLFKSVVAPLGIKGGGNAFVAQGGAPQTIDMDAILTPLEEKMTEIVSL